MTEARKKKRRLTAEDAEKKDMASINYIRTDFSGPSALSAVNTFWSSASVPDPDPGMSSSVSI
jgi:hypothetical protein